MKRWRHPINQEWSFGKMLSSSRPTWTYPPAPIFSENGEGARLHHEVAEGGYARKAAPKYPQNWEEVGISGTVFFRGRVDQLREKSYTICV